MRIIEKWKLAAKPLADSNPKGFKIQKAYFGLLSYIHKNDWQGACHASSAVFYVLLAEQGISAQLCLGEVRFDELFFDHSWIEIDDEVYDPAVSNTLIEGLEFPPVYRGIDLDSRGKTKLTYGVESGQGYDAKTDWILSIGLQDYMRAFPKHPQGLLGFAKELGKSIGISSSIPRLEKHVSQAAWQRRPKSEK